MYPIDIVPPDDCESQKAIAKIVDTVVKIYEQTVANIDKVIDNIDWREELLKATDLKDEAEVKEKLGIEYVDGAWKSVDVSD